MKVFLVSFFVLFSFVIYAQEQNSKKLYSSYEGVEIYVSTKNCINKQQGIEKQIIVMELINTNSFPVNFYSEKNLWFDNKCSNCDLNTKENQINYIIESNSSIKGGCETKNKSLNLFVKMLNLDNVRQLTKYELKNSKVEKIN